MYLKSKFLTSTRSNKTPERSVVLLLQVPRTNDKKELAAEQMFAALHGLLSTAPKTFFKKAELEQLSFEIAVLENRIGFYVCVSERLKDYVEEQIYAQYPMVQISQTSDYSAMNHDTPRNCVMAEMQLITNDALPIKTFQSFEVDPLASITATLAKFGEHEEAWIQIIIKPADHNWHKKTERYTKKLRNQNRGKLLQLLWTSSEESSVAVLQEYEQTRVRSAEEKSHKLAYETTIRIVYRGEGTFPEAWHRLQAITASYKQFNTTYLNGFKQVQGSYGIKAVQDYTNRAIGRTPLVLNIEEIATLYHLPHTNVETPYIRWALNRTAEPPSNLPIVSQTNQHTLSPMAYTNFRGINLVFGLPRVDRSRHLYILGQTGAGKSGLLEQLTIADIQSKHGFAIIDPHGDYAFNILQRIPESRIQDVVYFNPADEDFPVAFNPMEVLDPKLKSHTVSELIGVLKRMFESWGPRLEYILRYCLLALLEYPSATMLDITRILTDAKFRAKVLNYVTDPVVLNFWQLEFASWNERFASEAIAPVLNKVGAFTANPLVRNIIGQPKSSFNIRTIMDEGKILIVNLNRGLVGEDNAALLGALLVTKIQLAAMSRANIPIEQRAPFYLYVDEFQHFATDSFATILSEARKYGLNLTVANQYISQMSQEVREAVFGNVGSMIAFRMGSDDARVMQKYFEPKFEEYDLIHMNNRNIVINMTINGEKTQPFSAVTLNLPTVLDNEVQAIVSHSRAYYSQPKELVERSINSLYTNKTSLIPKSITNNPNPPPRDPDKPRRLRKRRSNTIRVEQSPLNQEVIIYSR